MPFYALAQRPFVAEGSLSYWGLPSGTIGSIDLSAVGAHNRVFIAGTLPFVAVGDILATFGDGTRLEQYVLSGRERNNWNSLLGDSIPNGTLLLTALRDYLTVKADPTGLTRCKPLMPTRRGVLELHLGGHSLIWSERLPDDPTTHPLWSSIQRVKQDDYRKHLADYGETAARKWLGNEQDRFRLSPERARDLIIPADLPRVLPLRPTTTFTDSFPTNGDIATGQDLTWVHLEDHHEAESLGGIQSILAAFTTAVSQAAHNVSSADHYVQFTYRARASEDFGGGPFARLQSGPTGYLAHCTAGAPGSGRDLYQGIGGSFSLLGSGGSSPQDGDDLRVECDGSNISLIVNGTAVVGPIVDTGVTSGLRGGCRNYTASTGNLSHFEISDLGAGAITGTLAATIAAVTSSSAGALKLQASSAAALAAVTAAAAGTLKLVGALAQTVEPVTLTATGGAPGIAGALSTTIDPVTASSAGTLPLVGALTATLDAVTVGSVGTLPIVGTMAATLDPVTANSAGVLPVVGTLASTVEPITLASEGAAGVVSTGELAATLDPVVATSVGQLLIAGETAASIADVTLSAEGESTPAVTGALAATLDPVVVSSTGALSIQALLAQTIDAIVVDSATELEIRGATAATIDPVTLSAFGLEAGVSVGTLAVTLAPITLRSRIETYDYDAIRNNPFNPRIARPRNSMFIRPWRTGW